MRPPTAWCWSPPPPISPGTEQGDPANVLQPAGTGGLPGRGLGIDVTAAEFSGARAGFAGYGSEVSMAAYGAFQPEANGVLGLGGPQAGIFGAFPGNPTSLEGSLISPCNCRTTFAGDDRYAYLAGTSMAAPQVAATAAMMRVLNPYATVPDVIGALEASASRAAGTGWTADLGWGVLNAGAALDAVRRVDRLAPVATVSAPRRSSHRTFVVRWSGSDPHPGALIASGVASYEVELIPLHHRARVIARHTTRRSLRFTGAAGATYTFRVTASTVPATVRPGRRAPPRRSRGGARLGLTGTAPAAGALGPHVGRRPAARTRAPGGQDRAGAAPGARRGRSSGA